MDFLTALKELRKSPKKKFDQTIDLIINLKNYDLRSKPINLFVEIPHKFKDNKICAFLESSSSEVDKTITKNEIVKYKDKKKTKKLAKEYGFFIANAKLMSPIATTFGKILGPLGKMPNPKFGGVLIKEEPALIKGIVARLKKMISIRPKELSIKIAIGKESMPDQEINENINVVYNSLMKFITKENINSLLLKFTMSKPVRV